MMIFYSNAANDDFAPSESPVDLKLDETLELWRSLVKADSFLGVNLSGNETLQFYISEEDGPVHLELLDSSGTQATSATVSREACEEAIKAAFEERPIQASLAAFAPVWETGSIG